MKLTQTLYIVPLLTLSAAFSGSAQPPSLAYRFAAPVMAGSNIGGHTFNAETAISGYALSETGIVAFSAEEQDGSGILRTGVYTHLRQIGQDGEAATGGKTIRQIIGAAIAINRQGAVAYEALYTDAATGGASHRGIFVEKQLALTLSDNAKGTAADFTLKDDGTVASPYAVATPTPSAPVANGKKDPGAGSSSSGDDTLQKLSDYAQNQTNNQHVKDTIKMVRSVFGTSKPQPAQPQPAQSSNPTGVASQSQAVPVVTSAPSCPAPAFPFPAEWALPAQVTGPITGFLFEPSVKGRAVYTSATFGKEADTFRVVEFSNSCKPQLIAIVDGSQRGRVEIYTPAGLLSYVRPMDESLVLPGFTGYVSPEQALRLETLPRANQRGQLLFSVKLTSGSFALLLATPVAGSR